MFFGTVVGIMTGATGTSGGGIGLAGISTFPLGLCEKVFPAKIQLNTENHFFSANLPWCLKNFGFGKVPGCGAIM